MKMRLIDDDEEEGEDDDKDEDKDDDEERRGTIGSPSSALLHRSTSWLLHTTIPIHHHFLKPPCFLPVFSCSIQPF